MPAPQTSAVMQAVATPSAQMRPRLARPGLPDRPFEPNPAMVVAAHSARGTSGDAPDGAEVATMTPQGHLDVNRVVHRGSEQERHGRQAHQVPGDSAALITAWSTSTVKARRPEADCDLRPAPEREPETERHHRGNAQRHPCHAPLDVGHQALAQERPPRQPDARHAGSSSAARRAGESDVGSRAPRASQPSALRAERVREASGRSSFVGHEPVRDDARCSRQPALVRQVRWLRA